MIDIGVLAGRTTSAFPLSIGTSLAFESLFAGRQDPYDKNRPVPMDISVRKYSEMWVNLATLFRNITGAIPKLDLLKIDATTVAATIAQEVEMIRSLMKEEGQGLCAASFYHCSYRHVFLQHYPQAVRFRTDSTEYQRDLARLMNEVFVLMRNEDQHFNQYHWLDDSLHPLSTWNAMLLSHMPYDLLSHRAFKRLDLLESHTGKLKSRASWYTKYAPLGKEDLSTLPFTKKLLLIFGDRVMFTPIDYRLRHELLTISRTGRWTPMTSEEKIVSDLKTYSTGSDLYNLYMALP